MSASNDPQPPLRLCMPMTHSAARSIASRVAGPVEAVERQRDGGGVVEIGVMRVGVLEGPAAGPQPGPRRRPVADRIEHLPLFQPVERAPDRRRQRRSSPTSISACAASAVSHTGDTQGWQ